MTEQLEEARQAKADAAMVAEVDAGTAGNANLPRVTVGAAITMAESENRAIALIGDGAKLVLGGLLVRALAEEHFQSSAVSLAAAGATGIAAALNWSRVAWSTWPRGRSTTSR